MGKLRFRELESKLPNSLPVGSWQSQDGNLGPLDYKSLKQTINLAAEDLVKVQILIFRLSNIGPKLLKNKLPDDTHAVVWTHFEQQQYTRHTCPILPFKKDPDFSLFFPIAHIPQGNLTLSLASGCISVTLLP
jgi:hypothetical protein